MAIHSNTRRTEYRHTPRFSSSERDRGRIFPMREGSYSFPFLTSVLSCGCLQWVLWGSMRLSWYQLIPYLIGVSCVATRSPKKGRRRKERKPLYVLKTFVCKLGKYIYILQSTRDYLYFVIYTLSVRYTRNYRKHLLLY